MTTICQTLTQLQALYGREKAESILGNHAVKICLNAANDVTAKYFSDLLGKATVKVETGSQSTSKSKETSTSKSDSYSYTSRQLMTPDEITRMPSDQSIVIFSNQRPIKAKKAFQFKLFPGVADMVSLAQNDYNGEMSLSQASYYHEQEMAWEVELEKRNQKLASSQLDESEEESELDSMDALFDEYNSRNREELTVDDML